MQHAKHLTATATLLSLALMLTACGGSSKDASSAPETAPRAVSGTGARQTSTTGSPELLTPVVSVALQPVATEGLVIGRRPSSSTPLADYVRTLAAGDADLLAVADSVGATESRVFDQIGTDVEGGADIAGVVPTTAGSTSVGPVTESTAAAPALAVGRGFAVRAQATAAAPRPFASLGMVNSMLSNLFGSMVPPGAAVGGKSPPTTVTDEGSTATGSIAIDVKADGESTFGLDFEVKIDRAAKSGEAGQKGVEAAKGSAALGFEATANPCPDATGTVNVTFRAKLGADIAAGAKSAIGTTEVSGTAKVNVDDSASVTGFDMDARQQTTGKNAAGTGTFVDSSGSIRMAWKGDDLRSTRTGDKLNRESQAVDFAERNRLHDDGMNKAADFVLGYVAALEVYWKGGRCVKVVATSPGQVKPGTVTPIQVSVVHKLEGQPLAIPVDATLSGPQSIDITRIERSPGIITHTASQDPKSAATIDLVSTSRRGIGKATVSITVGDSNAYLVVGGLEDFQVNQVVCDVMAPFVLTSPGVASMTFTGGLSGKVEATGVFNLHYSGTYIINLPDGPGKPGTMRSSSSGSIANQAGSGTEKYTLTPTTC